MRRRLCSASSSRPSSTSSDRSSPAIPHTASAVSSRAAAREHAEAREQPPVLGSSRSWLQSIAPRSVRWRSGRSRPPAVSRASRSPRRLGHRRGRQEPDPGGGQLDRQRQAVEPCGRSRRRAAAFSAVSAKSGRTRHRPLDEQAHRLRRPGALRPRSNPVGGSDSGGTGNSCSPETRSGARLVTMTVSFGADRSRSATIGARRDDLLEVVEHQQRGAVLEVVRHAIDAAAAAGRAARWTRRSPTARGPDRSPTQAARTTCRRGTGRRTSPASASDSRVLPVPPGPVSVSSRVRSSSATAPSTSARPTNVVSWGGRLLGVRSSVSSGGKRSLQDRPPRPGTAAPRARSP